MALPAFDAIAAEWPAARIDVFVGQHTRDVFAFRPSISTRPVSDTLDMSAAVSLSRLLRRGRYDAVINLDRSRWLRLASHTSRSILSAEVRSMRPEVRHEAEVYLDVVRSIGIATPVSVPVIEPTFADRDRAAVLLNDVDERIAVLHPGGAQNPGAAMFDKRWPADQFVELARALASDGIRVYLSGGPAETGLAGEIARRAGLEERAILAGKTSIETMAGVLSRSAIYVGPDTGMSHIAAAVGTPTVTIFGPTNPRRYRPLGRNVQVLCPAESWFIPDRDLRRTGTVTGVPSTQRVSVEDVLGAVRPMLGRFGGANPCGI